MALTAGTVWEARTTATAGDLNGGGFNPTAANFPTDATTDANTANTAAPVLSSATYTFVAGDVGAWVYVKSGTDWTPGWYQIASVAGGKATLNAAVGAAIQVNTHGEYVANTVAGCATVGTPTGGTYGVDYSQQDAAKLAITDLSTSGAGATTITSVTGGFTPVMVGNVIHITAGTQLGVGWYEITQYTDTNNVVIDRTPSGVGAGSAGVAKVGGALILTSSLIDSITEMFPASSILWVKSGTYTFANAFSTSSTNGTATAPIVYQGYTSLRGDTCNGSDRPRIDFGANAASAGQHVHFKNIRFTGTGAPVMLIGTGGSAYNCRFLNSSTTASRTAVQTGTDTILVNCEAVSQNGVGITIGTTRSKIAQCYVHDSVTGMSSSGAGITVLGCVFEACSTAALTLSSTGGSHVIAFNTFYGREAKMGTGLNLSGANSPHSRVFGNIFYGLTTGIAVATGLTPSNMGWYNNFYNNTTDVSNWAKSVTDTALNPGFTDAAQLSGSTATTASTTFTQSGGNFSSVTDNVDYLHVVSGTGVTTGRYLITAHTATTLTVNNALGTSNAGDVVWYVTRGHDLSVGTNMKAAAAGSSYLGGHATSYLDMGGVQREEAAAAAPVRRVILRR
jgi:hypothetical protein